MAGERPVVLGTDVGQAAQRLGEEGRHLEVGQRRAGRARCLRAATQILKDFSVLRAVQNLELFSMVMQRRPQTLNHNYFRSFGHVFWSSMGSASTFMSLEFSAEVCSWFR